MRGCNSRLVAPNRFVRSPEMIKLTKTPIYSMRLCPGVVCECVVCTNERKAKTEAFTERMKPSRGPSQMTYHLHCILFPLSTFGHNLFSRCFLWNIKQVIILCESIVLNANESVLQRIAHAQRMYWPRSLRGAIAGASKFMLAFIFFMIVLLIRFEHDQFTNKKCANECHKGLRHLWKCLSAALDMEFRIFFFAFVLPNTFESYFMVVASLNKFRFFSISPAISIEFLQIVRYWRCGTIAAR